MDAEIAVPADRQQVIVEVPFEDGGTDTWSAYWCSRTRTFISSANGWVGLDEIKSWRPAATAACLTFNEVE